MIKKVRKSAEELEGEINSVLPVSLHTDIPELPEGEEVQGNYLFDSTRNYLDQTKMFKKFLEVRKRMKNQGGSYD